MHIALQSALLDHPNASHFGTGLRNKKLKNLPPETFSFRFLPPWSSNLSYFMHKKASRWDALFVAEKERCHSYAQFLLMPYVY